MHLKLDENFLEELTTNIRMLYAEAIETARRDAAINKEYLSIIEASQYIGVSRATMMKNFIAKGLGTYVIEGKTWIRKSELEEFIYQNKI